MWCDANKNRILCAVMWHTIMLALLSVDGVVRTPLLQPNLYWFIVSVAMIESIAMWSVSILAAWNGDDTKGDISLVTAAEKYNSEHHFWSWFIFAIEIIFVVALYYAEAAVVPYPRHIIFLIILLAGKGICTRICHKKAAE